MTAHYGCTNKVRYRTAGDAVAAAGRLCKRLASFRPYACTHCHGWHLTSRLIRKKT